MIGNKTVLAVVVSLTFGGIGGYFLGSKNSDRWRYEKMSLGQGTEFVVRIEKSTGKACFLNPIAGWIDYDRMERYADCRACGCKTPERKAKCQYCGRCRVCKGKDFRMAGGQEVCNTCYPPPE